MKTIRVQYGVGYGTHTTEIEVEDDASDDEVEEWAADAVRDKFWWSWERPSDDEDAP